jgi:DmsE family decaheme c-type cytochrome
MEMKSAKKLWLALAASLGLLVTSAAFAADAPSASAAKAPPDLILKGDGKCTGCHDEADDAGPTMLELKPSVLSIGKTKHGTQADGRTPTCTNCHGESDRHMNHKGSGKPPKPDRLFAKNTPTPVEDRNAPCLTCHQGGKHINWQSSTHANRDVACTNCHQVHSQHDKVREKVTQAEVCYTCHKEQRAQMQRPSHHPVPEGQMTCTGCHDVHSDNPKALAKSTTNDTCYTCHMEKRGPFVHEHQPVAEDCANCHRPHGTTTPSLLTVRSPMLCQQCHQATTHTNPAIFNIANNGPASTGFQRFQLQGRGCMSCHSAIHGSNTPAANQHFKE